MALFMDSVALSNGLHGSVQMDSLALFSWIGWLRHRGILSDLLELMEISCNKKSTIFCSQYSFDGWHQLLNGGPIADAILDRIINSSYLITLHGKSLRETYSKLKDKK